MSIKECHNYASWVRIRKIDMHDIIHALMIVHMPQTEYRGFTVAWDSSIKSERVV